MECSCRPFVQDFDCEMHPSALRRQQEAFIVLKDETGLLHLEASRGGPVCEHAGPLTRRLHPITNAGIWCTACMTRVQHFEASRDFGDETRSV